MAGRKMTREGLAYLNTPEGTEKAIALAETGLGIEAMAKAIGVPVGAVRKWMEAPDHAVLFTRARERAADHLAVEALQISDDLERGEPSQIAKDKLRVETRKWLASKWDRKTYGDDKSAVNVQLNVADLHLRAVKDVRPVHGADEQVIDGVAERVEGAEP